MLLEYSDRERSSNLRAAHAKNTDNGSPVARRPTRGQRTARTRADPRMPTMTISLRHASVGPRRAALGHGARSRNVRGLHGRSILDTATCERQNRAPIETTSYDADEQGHRRSHEERRTQSIERFSLDVNEIWARAPTRHSTW